jgi:hypothetical protein
MTPCVDVQSVCGRLPSQDGVRTTRPDAVVTSRHERWPRSDNRRLERRTERVERATTDAHDGTDHYPNDWDFDCRRSVAVVSPRRLR